jgi:hypothetical protein
MMYGYVSSEKNGDDGDRRRMVRRIGQRRWKRRKENRRS